MFRALVSWCALVCRVVLCCVLLCRAARFRAVLCCALLRCAVRGMSCGVVPCCAVASSVLPCCAAPGRAVLYSVARWCAVLYWGVVCCVTLCSVVPCFAVPCSAVGESNRWFGVGWCRRWSDWWHCCVGRGLGSCRRLVARGRSLAWSGLLAECSGGSGRAVRSDGTGWCPWGCPPLIPCPLWVPVSRGVPGSVWWGTVASSASLAPCLRVVPRLWCRGDVSFSLVRVPLCECCGPCGGKWPGS